PPPLLSTLSPYTTLFRSCCQASANLDRHVALRHFHVSTIGARSRQMAVLPREGVLVQPERCRRAARHARYRYLSAEAGLADVVRSEEHTSELQLPDHLVC